MGHTARKAKEVKEKEVRHLAGAAARELFLECLQLVLRKQIAWLVKEKHFPVEFETVVRDLWDLRLRNFYGLKLVTDRDDPSSGAELSSRTELKLYSSQVDTDDSDTGAKSSDRRPRNWTSDPGERWNTPGLIDTLGLCYLGCLLLRLPYRVGDLYRWAKKNQILFLGAVGAIRSAAAAARISLTSRKQIEAIPKTMRDRLPAPYQRSLLARNASFAGGELHRAVLDLVRAYYVNYEMVFPGLNGTLILWQYTRELGLPGTSPISRWLSGGSLADNGLNPQRMYTPGCGN